MLYGFYACNGRDVQSIVLKRSCCIQLQLSNITSSLSVIDTGFDNLKKFLKKTPVNYKLDMFE